MTHSHGAYRRYSSDNNAERQFAQRVHARDELALIVSTQAEELFTMKQYYAACEAEENSRRQQWLDMQAVHARADRARAPFAAAGVYGLFPVIPVFPDERWYVAQPIKADYGANEFYWRDEGEYLPDTRDAVRATITRELDPGSDDWGQWVIRISNTGETIVLPLAPYDLHAVFAYTVGYLRLHCRNT